MPGDTKLVKDSGKTKPPAAGKGRPKGALNKNTKIIKDAIIQAAEEAGGRDGIVGYLKTQAVKNPGPFMSLMGKVLPTQIGGDPENPLAVVTKIERKLVKPDN